MKYILILALLPISYGIFSVVHKTEAQRINEEYAHCNELWARGMNGGTENVRCVQVEIKWRNLPVER